MFVALAASVTGAEQGQGQSTDKASRLPAAGAGKSDRTPTGRQDRLRIRKTDKWRPATPVPRNDTAAKAPDATDEPDLLDLLLPSDPHAETDEKPAKLQPSRRKAKTSGRRRVKRQSAGKAQPIGIAYKNGKLVLNRFHTMKLDMEHRECRRFPDFITADYKLPRNAIDTLADNLAIVQKRLCASNGSVMFTCYQNKATVSLRRARPDDGCRR